MRCVWAVLVMSAGALAHGDSSDELVRLSQALAVAPTPQLHLQRAILLRFAGRDDEALAELDRAATMPGAPAGELALQRGLTLFDAGRAREALTALDAWLGAGGTSVVGREARGSVLERLGRVDEAISEWSRVVAVAPSPERCLELARLQERRGLEGAARATLEQCVGTLGGAAAVRLALIDFERRAGHVDAAVQQARRAMRGQRLAAQWRLKAAEALLEAGRPQEARVELEAAVGELDGALARRPNALQGEQRRRVGELLGQLGGQR